MRRNGCAGSVQSSTVGCRSSPLSWTVRSRVTRIARNGSRGLRTGTPSKDSIYLAPHAVGRGAGGRLLDGLLARCSEAGIRQAIAVIVDDDAGASLALHRNRGFVDAGRLNSVGFKHGRWLDTVLLQRSLM